MASRLLSASRASSYLGTSVFYTGFVSGIYQTFLWWVFLYLTFYVYIYISETLRSGFGSIICVCKSKLLIYDSLIRILAFGNGVCFFFSQVSYLFTKFWFCLLLRSMGSWFLEMGLVCFCHSYDIYLPSFIYLFIIIKLLLRSMGTWIWALIYQYIFSVCVCENCTFKFL